MEGGKQRHSCWGRQGETGRQAQAGKGRETGSQRQASRLAEGSGQLKQAKVDVVRERYAGRQAETSIHKQEG
jgi:hypothetical protein